MSALPVSKGGELIVVAHVLNASVTDGFVPAAFAMGLDVVVLTDCAEAYRRHYAGASSDVAVPQVVACDVFNPLALIEHVASRSTRPVGIFSNSDHLQTATALAAAYFGLPGKDWQVTYRAKNKAEMRRYMRSRDPSQPWYVTAANRYDLDRSSVALTYPCVAKPREGVASEHVALVASREVLYAHCESVWRQQPEQTVLIEPYLDGELRTLETLGDGNRLQVLGGFDVSLSDPPVFVETGAVWRAGTDTAEIAQVLVALREFGVGFGACHTEYVLTADGPRIVEINYRSIGDRRDFMLSDLLGHDYFRAVLAIHLGEAAACPVATHRSGAMRYFVAPHAGRIERGPSGFQASSGDDRAWFVPLRGPGDKVAPTGSNRDYLGVLTVTGSAADTVSERLAQHSDQLVWEIRE